MHIAPHHSALGCCGLQALLLLLLGHEGSLLLLRGLATLDRRLEKRISSATAHYQIAVGQKAGLLHGKFPSLRLWEGCRVLRCRLEGKGLELEHLALVRALGTRVEGVSDRLLLVGHERRGS